jgi:hypothetical protein
MTELQASRTLVKSPPELWAECSDAGSLARHLGQFGDIRITRLEPETAVAWEGERARGTVRIEPAGWGTKVILTAVVAVDGENAVAPDSPAPAEPPAAESPRGSPAVEFAGEVAAAGVTAEPPAAGVTAEPSAAASAPFPRRPFARLLAFLRGPAPSHAPPQAQAPPADEEPDLPEVEAPPAAAVAEPDTGAALAAALDSLGQAHHRPYSRA